MKPQYLVYICTLPLVVIACVVVAAMPIGPRNNSSPWHEILEHLTISIVLGTMYGVTTVAAAWAALGPGWISLRIPLSLVVVALLVVALGFNIVLHNVPQGLTGIMGASVATQWLLSQAPLWAVAVICKLRLRHADESPDEAVRGQFGIRQLMLFTAVVGVLLGVGRIIATNVSFAFLGDREIPIFLFLVGAAMFMTLPLVFAVFLAHYWRVATLACVGFIILVTFVEWPVVATAFRNFGGPDLGHLVGINAVTTLWVLAFVSMTRLCGYHFRQPGVAAEIAKP